MKNLNSEIRTRTENQAVRVCRSVDGAVEFNHCNRTPSIRLTTNRATSSASTRSKAATTDGFTGYLTGNILKYIWRWKHKNGIEDLRKARWYLDRLDRGAGGRLMVYTRNEIIRLLENYKDERQGNRNHVEKTSLKNLTH